MGFRAVRLRAWPAGEARRPAGFFRCNGAVYFILGQTMV